jgi:hypothetical protein
MENANSLVAVLTDSSASIAHRREAASALARLDPATAAPILLSVGAKLDEHTEILAAVGEELAHIASQVGHFSEFDLRDISGATYDAYCEHLS